MTTVGKAPLDGMGLPSAVSGIAEAAKPRSYGQILKSSALVGGSSAINIVLSIVRAKAMALLLGPAGFGLLGLYGAIADLARTVASMGIGTSGVRQIAEAAATVGDLRIPRTVTTLRWGALWLGVIGGGLVAAFCRPIARISFGDPQNAGQVALLGLAVLFGTVAAGQMALVQGLRRIRDLALINVLSSLFGLLVAIPLVYLMGKEGVVLSLVAVAGVGLGVSWWYSQKVGVEKVRIGWADFSAEMSELLKLGFVFMASGFMMMGVAYLVRMIVLRQIGEEAAGFYQAAWALGGLYVGFILQAMGADFFPRLTAVSRDNVACNRLVNEQAEVSLLLAGPGIMGTLTFASLVIPVTLFLEIRACSRNPAVDLPGDDAAGRQLADEFHPAGQGGSPVLLLERVRCECCPGSYSSGRGSSCSD